MTFYANISGITRADFKHTGLTANQYNGLARPGELVVDLISYQLFIGNSTGNLNPVISSSNVSSNSISNGTSSVSIPQLNGNIIINVSGTYSWLFDLSGSLNSPAVNNTQVSWSGASTIVKGNPYTVYGLFGTPAIVYTASSSDVIACKLLVRLQYDSSGDTDLVEINAVKSTNNSSVTSTVSHLLSSMSNVASQIAVGLNGNNKIYVTANSQNGENFYSTYKVTEFDLTA